jgi:hypothetical protein
VGGGWGGWQWVAASRWWRWRLEDFIVTGLPRFGSVGEGSIAGGCRGMASGGGKPDGGDGGLSGGNVGQRGCRWAERCQITGGPVPAAGD